MFVDLSLMREHREPRVLEPPATQEAQVSTPLFLSHILIKVDDLPTAVADYERLGFTVTWGSEPTKTLNALIHFRAHAFLELFAPGEALGQAEERALAAADHLT